MGLKIPKINWIPYDNLKDIFFMIGVFVSITLVSVIAITSVIKIRDLISDYRDTKRYEYKIAHRFDKTVWLYTGYLWEEIRDLPGMKWIDILVDGEFVDELSDVTYHWAGSTNQRVIDVQKSLRTGKVILKGE